MSKRAIIIEDEKLGRENLEKLLQLYSPTLDIVGNADGVESGLKLIEDKHPDLLFLDVKIKGGTAFDLLEKLKSKINFQLIFVTAYNEYAAESYRCCALDYILKPIDPFVLQEVVQKAMNQPDKDLPVKVQTLQQNWKGQPKLILTSLDKLWVIKIRDILRCEADDNYTIFYIDHQPKIVVTKTLKEYEDILGNMKFLRVHRSHLININHVTSYLYKDNEVVMKDGSHVPVSRGKKESLLELLGK